MKTQYVQALLKAQEVLRGLSFKDSKTTGALEAIQTALADDTSHFTEPRNVLPNGLTMLQVNPDCAAQLDSTDPAFGWLYIKGPEGQWVTRRKLSPGEIEVAQDQAADMAVLHGTQVRT